MQDELPGLIDAGLLGSGLDDDLAFLEFFQAGLGHEPGWDLWVDVVVKDDRLLTALLLRGLVDLDQVFGGEEALVGQQTLVDAAELDEAQFRVVDPTDLLACPAPGLTRAQAEAADDLIQHPVRQLHPFQQRRGPGVEQSRGQGLDDERLGMRMLDRLAATFPEAELAGAVVAKEIVLEWHGGAPG